jgi:hypothetical protein
MIALSASSMGPSTVKSEWLDRPPARTTRAGTKRAPGSLGARPYGLGRFRIGAGFSGRCRRPIQASPAR